ncbi:MAG: hypothetical protein PHF84_10650 [bacterium]|nr:hypothetical protein [bacterium]
MDGKIHAGGRWINYGSVFKSGYVSSSQAVLNFKPARVDKWLSFTRLDSLAENIVYEFTYTTNAGADWSSSWLPLNDSNLQKIRCSADGRDQINVRLTMTSINHDITPSVDWLSIDYQAINVQYDDLDQVLAAPNPFNALKQGDREYIIFFHLTPEFEMKIYSSSGGEVAGIKGRSKNGTYKWTPVNNQGKKLKSGVYICYITNSSGQSKKIKLAILR